MLSGSLNIRVLNDTMLTPGQNFTYTLASVPSGCVDGWFTKVEVETPNNKQCSSADITNGLEPRANIVIVSFSLKDACSASPSVYHLPAFSLSCILSAVVVAFSLF